VVVRHTEPGGGWHFDWMIDRVRGRDRVEGAAGDALELMTFRTMVRPDDAMVRSFDAERTPDHRAAYLTREGEVSGGRGTVARVAAGWCVVASLEAHRIDVTVDTGGGARRIVGRWIGTSGADGLGEWRFVVGDGPGR
jgi:hypothetical protein